MSAVRMELDVTPPQSTNQRPWHKLKDILMIGLCTAICGKKGYAEMELFGSVREASLRSLLELPCGIPDTDTFRYIFEWLNPKKLNESLKYLCLTTSIQISEHSLILWNPLAEAAQDSDISSILELLDLVDIGNTIITLDIPEYQQAASEKILKAGADYILEFKGKQPVPYKELQDHFAWLEQQPAGKDWARWQTQAETGDGRSEQREVIATDTGWMGQETAGWPGLSKILRYRHTYVVNGVHTCEDRYYLSSLTRPAKDFASLLQEYRPIKNRRQWTLEARFRQEACAFKENHTAQNLDILRKYALALLKSSPDPLGISGARFHAALSWDYLSSILAQAYGSAGLTQPIR